MVGDRPADDAPAVDVKQLLQSIRANGGLTDPLIVRDGDFVVLEGNSRLAAYRLLARNDPVRWGMVKVKLLPEDIGEDLVFALLGEYHIVGRKDWAPYEQAGYLYRRQQNHGADSAAMAKEVGMSTKAINHLIRVYTFMVEHKDNDVNRWSYYDEYLKHTATKKAREEHPELDNVVVSKIASGEIPRAIDVRDKLIPIAKAGGNTLKKFTAGKATLEASYDRALLGGANNPWPARLKTFRLFMVEGSTYESLKEMPQQARKKCLYELNKIHQATEDLLTKLK